MKIIFAYFVCLMTAIAALGFAAIQAVKEGNDYLEILIPQIVGICLFIIVYDAIKKWWSNRK